MAVLVYTSKYFAIPELGKWFELDASGSNRFHINCHPSIALANAGIPMLAFTLPLMVIGLVPVIVVEAIFIARGLALSLRAAALLSGVANLVSMLIGVPLTWLALMALQGVTGGGSPLSNESHSTFLYILEAIWNAPWMGGFGPGWQITLAMLVLLVPYFLASWLIEFQIIARLTKLNNREVRRVSLFANATTYALMGLYVLIQFNAWANGVSEMPPLFRYLFDWVNLGGFF